MQAALDQIRGERDGILAECDILKQRAEHGMKLALDWQKMSPMVLDLQVLAANNHKDLTTLRQENKNLTLERDSLLEQKSKLEEDAKKRFESMEQELHEEKETNHTMALMAKALEADLNRSQQEERALRDKMNDMLAEFDALKERDKTGTALAQKVIAVGDKLNEIDQTRQMLEERCGRLQQENKALAAERDRFLEAVRTLQEQVGVELKAGAVEILGEFKKLDSMLQGVGEDNKALREENHGLKESNKEMEDKYNALMSKYQDLDYESTELHKENQQLSRTRDLALDSLATLHSEVQARLRDLKHAQQKVSKLEEDRDNLRLRQQEAEKQRKEMATGWEAADDRVDEMEEDIKAKDDKIAELQTELREKEKVAALDKKHIQELESEVDLDHSDLKATEDMLEATEMMLDEAQAASTKPDFTIPPDLFTGAYVAVAGEHSENGGNFWLALVKNVKGTQVEVVWLTEKDDNEGYRVYREGKTCWTPRKYVVARFERQPTTKSESILLHHYLNQGRQRPAAAAADA